MREPALRVFRTDASGHFFLGLGEVDSVTCVSLEFGFRHELDATVDFRQRQFRADFPEGNDGFEHVIHFPHKALFRAAEDDGGRLFLLEAV